MLVKKNAASTRTQTLYSQEEYTGELREAIPTELLLSIARGGAKT
jgi:hypothetical protein